MPGIPTILENEIKIDQPLPPEGIKPAIYSAFAFNVDGKGGILPTSGLSDLSLRFGGTGSDGALSISSGTTTVDLGAAKLVTKNYSSISITGTGKLAFSNPHANGSIIILKCSGNAALSSSTTPNIDVSGMGATGGTANASDGNAPNELLTTGNNYGLKGTAVSGAVGQTPGAGASGGVIYPTTTGIGLLYTQTLNNLLYRRSIYLVPGAGGGGSFNGGSGSSGTAGIGQAGGNGGGALIMEIAGIFTYSVSGGISVNGANGVSGTNGVGNGTGGGGGGGGGGGAGGMAVVLYNSGSPTGTVTTAGGSGGNGGNGGNASVGGGSGGAGGSGGSGAGAILSAGGSSGAGGAGGSGAPGGNGTAGGASTNGAAGSAGLAGTGNYSGGGGGGGGGGSDGSQIFAKNTLFA